MGDFGMILALIICIVSAYCHESPVFTVISLLIDTLPRVSGLSVSGGFLRCLRPELPPGRGDRAIPVAGSVPMPPKLLQRCNDGNWVVATQFFFIFTPIWGNDPF